MATLTKFNSFVEALAEKAHNLGSDSLVVALCDAAHAPVVTNTKLVDLTEVAYTYCSSRALTISSSSQSSGLYKLVLADLVLTASGGSVGPFRYIVLYNDTATDDLLIGFFDYGSEITLASGETLTLDFDPTNGVLQIQ